MNATTAMTTVRDVGEDLIGRVSDASSAIQDDVTTTGAALLDGARQLVHRAPVRSRGSRPARTRRRLLIGLAIALLVGVAYRMRGHRSDTSAGPTTNSGPPTSPTPPLEPVDPDPTVPRPPEVPNPLSSLTSSRRS